MNRFANFAAPVRKALLLLAAFFTGAGVCAAERPGKENSEKTVVKVFGLPNPGSTSSTDIADLRVLEAFSKKYSHIELKSVTGLKVEGMGSEIGPLMMIAGGISPDVLYVNFRKIDSYVRQGILYPLDEFIEKETAGNPGWKGEHILPQIEDVIRRPGPDNETRTYALPYRYYVMGLYFNRSLFRQVGLPQRTPKDWDELVEFSRKIKAVNPRNKPLLLNAGQQASWNLMNFLWSTGGEAVEEIEKNEWRAVFNSDAAVDAFEFYYQLVEGDRIATRATDAGTQINSAESRYIGMTFGYIGASMSFDPNVWGFGAVPKGPTGIRGSEVNAGMMGIFAGVKDPKVRAAAWEYINFYGSDEAQRIRTEALVELGTANVINPVDLRRFGFTSFLEMVPPGTEEEFKIAMANGKPEPYGKNCDLVYLEMTYPLDQILLSSKIANSWKTGDKKAVKEEIKRILDTAVKATDERMLGIVPPEKMAQRRGVGWVVVLVIIGAFVLVGRVIFKSFSEAGAATSRVRGKAKFIAWGMLIIPLGLAFTWSYLPLARGAWMSLLDYQIMLKSTFVGIDNFANTLFDKRFWSSMLATFHFAFWMLTVGFCVPITLAYLLHVVPRHKLLFRTLYYLPALLTGTAVFVLWKEFFAVNGVINTMLDAVGIHIRRAWPEDPAFAMISCVLPGVWAGAGPGCLIYLAALKTIPEEQFEASEIDGAGFWRKTFHIVVPALLPLIAINFIGAVMGAFQASQNILIMTAGGPNAITEVAALRIFYQAFMFLQFGPATAMAWILGSLLVGFALIQLKRLSRMEFKRGG